MGKRRLLLTFAAGLLVLFLASGLAGCSRPASMRDPQATIPAATLVAEAPLDIDAQAPASKETVVSAVPAGTNANEPTAEGWATPAVSADVDPAAELPETMELMATPLPAATVPPALEPGEEMVTHTVQRDETLSTIAARYETTVQAIVEANNLSDPSQIFAGQILKIPASAGSNSGQGSGVQGGDETDGTSPPACRHKHVVRRGEWLYKISGKYDVSLQKILRANNLTAKQAGTIHAGQVLCIP